MPRSNKKFKIRKRIDPSEPGQFQSVNADPENSSIYNTEGNYLGPTTIYDQYLSIPPIGSFDQSTSLYPRKRSSNREGRDIILEPAILQVAKGGPCWFDEGLINPAYGQPKLLSHVNYLGRDVPIWMPQFPMCPVSNQPYFNQGSENPQPQPGYQDGCAFMGGPAPQSLFPYCPGFFPYFPPPYQPPRSYFPKNLVVVEGNVIQPPNCFINDGNAATEVEKPQRSSRPKYSKGMKTTTTTMTKYVIMKEQNSDTSQPHHYSMAVQEEDMEEPEEEEAEEGEEEAEEMEEEEEVEEEDE